MRIRIGCAEGEGEERIGEEGEERRLTLKPTYQGKDDG